MGHPQQMLDAAIRRLGENQAIAIACEDGELLINRDHANVGHFQLARRNGLLFIRDLDSPTGTFLNGNEVRGLVNVRSGDTVRFGDREIVLPVETPMAVPSAGSSGTITTSTGFDLAVDDAVMTVKIRADQKTAVRNILDHVSLQAQPGQFIGILGASGSGKSTLLKAIAGIATLSHGEIRLNFHPVTSAHLQNQSRIAYLPQDVIVHQALTPRVALNYIAVLKELGINDAERQQLVSKALERVGLAHRVSVPIRQLSGGQRKRVALAAELLGDPGLILLDEATSGLDPATEEEMMQLFRSLAEEGRTMLCITHFPGRLHICDSLLFLLQGKCVFFGAPDSLLKFFDVRSIEDVYTRQGERSADEWEARFREEVGRSGKQSRPVKSDKPETVDEPAKIDAPLHSFVEQTKHLTSRYLLLQLADLQNLALLFAQAPIIALMIAATFGSIKVDFVELHAADTKEVIFLLALSVLWCSGTASVREIVKEMPILRHETRFGVRLLPYLTSKLILLGLISLTQTFLLLVIVRYLTEMPGPFAGQFSVLAMTGLTGVALGLFVSAVAGTSERAMTVLPVILIGQAIFSGGLARIEGVARAFAILFNPAWWSLDGIRSTFSTNLVHATYPGAPGHYQPPILGPGGPILLDLAALVLQMLVLVGITSVVLGQKLNRPVLSGLLRRLKFGG